jgi:adenosylcobinamide kinase / adenosylcobinamide-phosphate guanylyltransferase
MSLSSQEIILVTGAARSGKSEWAEILAQKTAKSVIYIATATLDPQDAEWQERIKRHQQRRPDSWETRSIPCDLVAAIDNGMPTQCLLIDSLGTWVANLLELDEKAWQATTEDLLTSLKTTAADIILVGEETGWGVVPAYRSGRIFRDRLGDLVRNIGSVADSVYLVAGGRVLDLSRLGIPLPRSFEF